MLPFLFFLQYAPYHLGLYAQENNLQKKSLLNVKPETFSTTGKHSSSVTPG